MPRKPPKVSQFYLLWKAQRGRCFYCGEEMEHKAHKDAMKPDRATFDHVIPKAKGGSQRKTKNTVLACRACNQKKGALSPREFVALHGKPALADTVSKKKFASFGF